MNISLNLYLFLMPFWGLSAFFLFVLSSVNGMLVFVLSHFVCLLSLTSPFIFYRDRKGVEVGRSGNN